MSLYRNLIQNPPKLEIIKPNPTKILINMVSCMCDNKSQIVITKVDKGYHTRSVLSSGMGYSMSNYQMGHSSEDLKWEVEEQNWNIVFKMINSGTAQIESIKVRYQE